MVLPQGGAQVTSAIRCRHCGSTLATVIHNALHCARESCRRPIESLDTSPPEAAPITDTRPEEPLRAGLTTKHTYGDPW